MLNRFKSLLIANFLAVVCLFPASVCLAKGGFDSSGGDDVALEFIGSFRAALSEIAQNDPAAHQELLRAGLNQNYQAEILIVDRPLRVRAGRRTQTSVAINQRSRRRIYVNRARWADITSRSLRKGIALHEFASLVGLEGTGRYKYSGQYYAARTIGQVEDTYLRYATNDHRDVSGSEFRIRSQIHAYLIWTSEQTQLCYVEGQGAKAKEYLQEVLTEKDLVNYGVVEFDEGAKEINALFGYNYEDTETESNKTIGVCPRGLISH